MATILETLRAISTYPIPQRTFEEIALSRGLNLSAYADEATLQSNGFKLAKADLYMWLVCAPNVSQGGQSISFSSEEREQLKRFANALYSQANEPENRTTNVVYGYKGDLL